MSLLTVIKSIFGFGRSADSAKKSQPGDRTLVCIDCSNEFIFDAGEQVFFKAKGFTDPKRCPTCRKKVKSQIKKKRRGSGGGGMSNSQSNNSRGSNRRFGRRPHSLIDGDSPYEDER